MITFATIAETRHWLEERQLEGKSTGFVPTMGALHEGHLALVRRAVGENDLCTASIFVNPIQFNNPEDLEKYPRTLEEDKAMLEETGCSMLFAPSVEEMYPGPVTVKYDFGPLERVMEGAFRPGHFNGVAVVVKKLFEIIRPGKAYFGEKDYQQLKIIQAMVAMEKLPVEIVPCPTVREADGLAMSSRNRRLNAEERERAPEIFRTMLEVKRLAGKVSVEEARQMALHRLTDAGFRPEYVEMASPADLTAVTDWQGKGGARIFVAAYLGNVRLIDNLEII